MESSPTIRRLSLGEALLYRGIRLEGLPESPEAFATSYESALARDLASWEAQADGSAVGGDRATFLAIAGRPVGLAALYRDAAGGECGDLIQMWIAPAHRGGRLAVDLLDHLFEWASRHAFAEIRAEVTPGNGRALRFYERYGFRRIAAAQDPPLLAKAV